jgi:hypothetical protein
MRSMTDEGMMGVFWAATVEPSSATVRPSSYRFAVTFSQPGEGKFSAFIALGYFVKLYLSVYFPSPLRERLSVLSSEISIGFSCFSCFGVEAGKEFMGQRDADDHFGFSFLDEALFEGL